MPFGLKNVKAMYQKMATKVFKGLASRNVKAYIDDMLVKSVLIEQHLIELKELLRLLRKYQMKLNPAKRVFYMDMGKFLDFMISKNGIKLNSKKLNALINMSPPKTVKEVQMLTGRIIALKRFISKMMDKCLPFFKNICNITDFE